MSSRRPGPSTAGLAAHRDLGLDLLVAALLGLVAEAPAAAAGYLIDEDLLDHPVGADPLAADRVAMRSYHLGDFGTGPAYAEAFLGAARAVIARERPAVTGTGIGSAQPRQPQQQDRR